MSEEPTAILIESDTAGIPWTAFRVDLSTADVIALLYRLSDAQWVDAWDEHVDTWPASMTILATRTTTRGDSSGTGRRLPHGLDFTVAEITPTNLTQTGTQITEALQTIDGDERPLLVYCDSVTTLLQFNDLPTTYRFFHALRSRVNAAGGTLYVQIDPAAHDKKTFHTLLQLFDASIEV